MLVYKSSLIVALLFLSCQNILWLPELIMVGSDAQALLSSVDLSVPSSGSAFPGPVSYLREHSPLPKG